MMPRHHVQPEMLLAYAGGGAEEPLALLVASHLTFCPICRDAVAELEAVGGALLEALPAEPLGTDALRRVLERGTAAETASFVLPDLVPSRAVHGGRLPSPLRRYVGGDLDDIAWRGRGRLRERRLLPHQTEYSTRLLRIRAGAAMPRHTHGGTELTLVLTGGFADERDHYGVGDVAIADVAVDHRPVADGGEDCICLAVTDAPLRLTGFGGPLLNLFVKG